MEQGALLITDIYDALGENLEDGKNFATIADALTFMTEVARG